MGQNVTLKGYSCFYKIRNNLVFSKVIVVSVLTLIVLMWRIG